MSRTRRKIDATTEEKTLTVETGKEKSKLAKAKIKKLKGLSTMWDKGFTSPSLLEMWNIQGSSGN